MGGLIMLFSSGVTAPQYRKNPPNWRSRFCRRRDSFRLKLSELVRLLMSERWPATCGGLAASKCPSELISSSCCSRPQLICLADSCSRWANWWLIITAYRRIGLLRKRTLTCGGKTRFCGPSESFCVFPAISGCKHGSANNPSKCARSLNTIVYDGCNG